MLDWLGWLGVRGAGLGAAGAGRPTSVGCAGRLRMGSGGRTGADGAALGPIAREDGVVGRRMVPGGLWTGLGVEVTGGTDGVSLFLAGAEGAG